MFGKETKVVAATGFTIVVSTGGETELSITYSGASGKRPDRPLIQAFLVFNSLGHPSSSKRVTVRDESEFVHEISIFLSEALSRFSLGPKEIIDSCAYVELCLVDHITKQGW